MALSIPIKQFYGTSTTATKDYKKEYSMEY